MREYAAVIVIMLLSGIICDAELTLYDDFSTENNTNWTTDAGASGMIDLHAYDNKTTNYPYAGGPLYREGEVAWRSSGTNSPYAMIKTSLDDSGGEIINRMTFDFKYREDWSSSWSERIFIGDLSGNNYIYIEQFADNKDRDGKRYFVGTNTGSGDVDIYSSLPANPKDWYHYDITLANGSVTIKRWDIGFRRNDNPHPYDPGTNAPLDETTFSFSLPSSGNELTFQSYGKSQDALLDDVYFDFVPPNGTFIVIK